MVVVLKHLWEDGESMCRGKARTMLPLFTGALITWSPRFFLLILVCKRLKRGLRAVLAWRNALP